MRPITPVLLIACLGLTSCWQSRSLLLDRAGARALPDGTYAVTVGTESVVLTWRGDGTYSVTSPDGEKDTGVFNSLGRIKDMDTYAFAIASPDCDTDPGKCEWDYAVVAVSGSGAFVATPDCALPADKAVAVKFGVTPDHDTCVFTDAKGLKAALAEVAARGPGDTRYEKK